MTDSAVLSTGLPPVAVNNRSIKAPKIPARMRVPFSPSPQTEAILSGLNVGFVVNYFPVLTESFVAYAAAGLIRCGSDVSILPLYQGLHEDTAHAPVGVLESNDLSDRIIAPRFANEGLQRILNAPSVLLSDLKSSPRRIPRLFDRRLRGVYEREAFKPLPDFDIIHCHFGTLAQPILRHRRDGALTGKVIVHFRGYDISKTIRRHGTDFYKDVFASADGFVTNCEYFKRTLASFGCPEELIDVAPSGLDLSAFPFAPNQIDAHRPLRLLTIGRLTEKKGISDGIEALAILRQNGIDARYRVVGEGHLRHSLEEQVRALNLQDYVEMPGLMKHDDIMTEFAQADIFLAPSVTSFEGDQDAPVNTLKEAMALGVPVVATDHGGIPELVIHEKTGLIAPEHSPEDLARNVIRYTQETDLVSRLLVAARDEVEQKWSLEYGISVYAQAYQKAMARPYRDPKLRQN